MNEYHCILDNGTIVKVRANSEDEAIRVVEDTYKKRCYSVELQSDNLADKMFSDLGYIGKGLRYEGKYQTITFNLNSKKYWIMTNAHGDNSFVCNKLHLAIHQKLKELGWI
ncbi:hypothetical protein G7059_08020 [Erysipelothrix sp. HDW6A]|uniref:hypothetical protein n=1 Tax=Erysipelothrix sp. HDW6A TaxID=2714928 RepID=UPI0014077492|nr:hypothetical protein [Erysipelothrix sp. HDW6A]QIK57788.1 hypothetical protein G7059_08020 [Erysipelothrix sp. HDW6A]